MDIQYHLFMLPWTDLSQQSSVKNGPLHEVPSDKTLQECNLENHIQNKVRFFKIVCSPIRLNEFAGILYNSFNGVFSDYIEQFIVIYLDDTLIYSEILEDHFKHIWLVIQILRENTMYEKLLKLVFGV